MTTPFQTWKLLETYGFPTAIALILLFTLLGWVPSPMLESHATIEQRLGTHVEADGRVQGVAAEQVRLLRLICRSTAGSELLRLECDK